MGIGTGTCLGIGRGTALNLETLFKWIAYHVSNQSFSGLVYVAAK